MIKKQNPFKSLIKKLFNTGDVPKKIEEDVQGGEVEVSTKGVSDPIYLLVEKLLENPKLLKVRLNHGYEYKHYSLSLPAIQLEGHIIKGPSYFYALYLEGIDLTSEEEDYLIGKLSNVLTDRGDRLTNILSIRKGRTEKALRTKLQNKLENIQC